MARARNIKPGFFKNEELASVAFEYRLLFAGLWTLADREGRLEDRPKRIRMELFPADDVDCELGLQALASTGLVVRYEVEGRCYIWIPTFLEHQKPHLKECASVIPAPLGSGEHLPRSVPAPTKAQTSPADCLLSESLLLESPLPDSKNVSVASATVFDKALAASASAAALPLSEAKINPDTPAGILASVCVANSIQATAFHPLVVEWARNGVTTEGLKSAIATARIRKPSPQKIPVAYLDTILADVGSPKPDARWRTDDGECERVARELGLWPARAKESWNDLRNRIAEALHSEARKAVQ